MSLWEWLRSRLDRIPENAARIDAGTIIPSEVRAKLIEDNPDEPLWPRFGRFGRGKPGVTRETPINWVVRDGRGRVAGGAVVTPIGDGGFHTVDVAVHPRHRRRGYATQLYEEIARAGINIEACSNASLHLGTMTALGCAFMVGRRRKALRGGGSPLADLLGDSGIDGPTVPDGWVLERIETVFGSPASLVDASIRDRSGPA